MALFENGERVLAGLAIGLGAVVLGPMVLGVIAGVTKPIIKAGIKGGLMAYDKAKVIGAEAKETLEDLTAEARAELEQANMASAVATAAAETKGGTPAHVAKGQSRTPDTKKSEG